MALNLNKIKKRLAEISKLSEGPLTEGPMLADEEIEILLEYARQGYEAAWAVTVLGNPIVPLKIKNKYAHMFWQLGWNQLHEELELEETLP